MTTPLLCSHTVTGSGPALFMIHGIGANRSVWDGMVQQLTAHFTCITYDLRGHGASPMPGGIFTLDDLIEDLERLRRELGIEQAHFIGHSLGGMIGPAYQQRFPDRVLSLGLISTAAFRTEEDAAKVQGVVAGMRKRGVEADLDVLNARWFSDQFVQAHADVVERRRQQVLDTEEQVFLNVFDIYATTEMAPWLHQVTVPSLVLTGAEDGGCNPRLNRQIADALPSSRLHIVDGVKHAILLEAADRVAKEWINFHQDHFAQNIPADRRRYTDTPLLINGTWRAGANDESIDVENPATLEIIGQVAKASSGDLEAVVAGAQVALDVWRNASVFNRYTTMRKAADLIRARADHVANIMSWEQGKPPAEARAEVIAAADIIDWFAEEGRRAYGRIIPARVPDVLQQVVQEPVGVVAAFTPWNFPVNQAVRKVSAALAAGCSIIVKGPEETPASCAALIRAFYDAGLPAGCVNLVFGEPAEISSFLISHPVVQKISFTGSTAVGKKLAALAGQHMKRVTMELGGHAPAMVFADADLDQAAQILTAAKFRNGGQVCVSPTRFLVERSVADAFTNQVAILTRKIRVGSGDGYDMGPLANARRVEAMERLVTDAVEKGARLVCGGRRISNSGHFFEPTVLADVPLSAEIMHEEPFGPIIPISPFDSLEDVILEANRLPYGLAAYAFAADANTIARLGQEVQSGMISINHYGLGLPEVPFGGIKDSGIGTEGGADALGAYLIAKFVTHKIG